MKRVEREARVEGVDWRIKTPEREISFGPGVCFAFGKEEGKGGRSRRRTMMVLVPVPEPRNTP